MTEITSKVQEIAEIRPTNASSLVPKRYTGFGGQYIDGSWRPGKQGGKELDRDPYSGETLAEIIQADRSDLDQAYQAAARAQISWAAAIPAERAAVMQRAAAIIAARHDEIVDWLIRESGSTRVKAELEWQFVHSVTLESSSFPHRVEGKILALDEAGKESRAYRQPLGVIGVISPWNFPMYLSQRSIGPALALGNAVVVKPAEDTPVTGGLLIAKIFEEAGLPAGLLNIVMGPIDQIGDAFTLHPVPKLISFTGSTRVGRHIGGLAMSGPQLKRVALELGGNAPSVILDDADVEYAVRATVVGRFLHQGQICMSTNRIIVDTKVYDEFVDRFAAHVKGLKYGNPHDPDVAIGPIINQKQLKSHLAHIEAARAAGARQLVGGNAQGQVLPPHVFVDVTNDNLQGRNIRECGAKGAVLVRVEDEEIVESSRLLVGRIRWASISADLTGASTENEAFEIIREAVGQEVDAADGIPVIFRMTLTGVTSLHRSLHSSPERVADEVLAAANHCSDLIWLESVKLETSETITLAAGDDSSLSSLDLGSMLGPLLESPEVKTEARQALDLIKGKFPSMELPGDLFGDDKLAALLEEARDALLGSQMSVEG